MAQSYRSDHLERQAKELERRLKELHRSIRQVERTGVAPLRPVTPAPPAAPAAPAEPPSAAPAAPPPRTDPYYTPARPSAPPTAAGLDPYESKRRFASYLTSGGFIPPKPLRQERRLVRNKAIFMVIVVSCAALILLTILLRP